MKSLEDIEIELNHHIDWVRNKTSYIGIPEKWFNLNDYPHLTKLYNNSYSWQSLINVISINCKLSEDFIEYYKDYIYWISISKYHKVTEDFIIKYIDKISFYMLHFNKYFNYQSTSKKFKLLYGKEFVNDSY